jgi:hypothetical protein
MAKGDSGRIIAELDPELKRKFYAALSLEGLTFKEWLQRRIEVFIDDHHQPSLFHTRKDSSDFPELKVQP